MQQIARAIVVALGVFGYAGAAYATTYVVTANSNSFDGQLARKVEAAGGRIVATLPQIGVLLCEAMPDEVRARARAREGNCMRINREYRLESS